jgi:hypothetical protein
MKSRIQTYDIAAVIVIVFPISDETKITRSCMCGMKKVIIRHSKDVENERRLSK